MADAMLNEASLSYAESFPVEDDVIAAARGRARELGCVPIGPYDLVFVDADKTAYGVYFEQALRLLRPGGVMAFDNALWHDRVADSTQRDADTTTLRELCRTVRDDKRLIPALLPVSDGLLVAAKR